MIRKIVVTTAAAATVLILGATGAGAAPGSYVPSGTQVAKQGTGSASASITSDQFGRLTAESAATGGTKRGLLGNKTKTSSGSAEANVSDSFLVDQGHYRITVTFSGVAAGESAAGTGAAQAQVYAEAQAESTARGNGNSAVTSASTTAVTFQVDKIADHRGVHWPTVRRVNVVGVSGSGKTTTSAALAARLGVPHVELDSIFHQPGWTALPDAEFRRRVEAATAGTAWVVDGNYSRVRDVVWGRADTIVVLDLPRWRVMSQLLARTLRRTATRAELWNGNREQWANLIRRDPAQNILLWAWTRYPVNRQRYRAALTDPRWRHVAFLRVRSRREVGQLVRALPASR